MDKIVVTKAVAIVSAAAVGIMSTGVCSAGHTGIFMTSL